MNQIERIKHMEQILDDASASIRTLSDAFYSYLQVLPGLSELADYYNNGQWLNDYQDDEAGRIPANLKRGVLSQDAVYNLLEDNAELLQTLKILSEKLTDDIHHGGTI